MRPSLFLLSVATGIRIMYCSFNECGKGIYVFLFGLSWIYLENESVRIKKMEFS